MQALVLAGLGALGFTAIAVGAKLLWLAHRTGGFPERALGIFFVFSAGLGYPLSAASAMAGEWQAALASVSAVFTGISQAMLFLFTARVFCRGERRGTVGAVLGLALVVLYVFGMSISQLTAQSDADLLRGQMVWGSVSLLMSAASFGWTGLEALRHWGRARRRLALGLADPVATNRMLLWGLMGSSTIVVVLVDAVLFYTTGEEGRTTWIPLATCAGGLVVAVLLLLAFFPPPRYLARVRRQAAEATATA